MTYELGDSHILLVDASGAVGAAMRDVNWTLTCESLLPGGAYEQDSHHFTMTGYTDLIASAGASTKHFYSSFDLGTTTTFHQIPFAWTAKRVVMTASLLIPGTSAPLPRLVCRLYKGSIGGGLVFQLVSNGASAAGMKWHSTTTTMDVDGEYEAGENVALRLLATVGATPAYWGSVFICVEGEAYR